MTRTGWTLAAVATALFCVQIDYFALNLALPRIAADFGSTTTDLQWVISVYMLALGAFMVPAGRFGDIFGRRRTLLAGVALFGAASMACALAPGRSWRWPATSVSLRPEPRLRSCSPASACRERTWAPAPFFLG